MAKQKQDDQLEHTYSSYVRIRMQPEDLPKAMNDREKWRERSGISVLMARHDDDDDTRLTYIRLIGNAIIMTS